MPFIKEFRPRKAGTNVAPKGIVRSLGGSHSLETFLAMFEIAQRDFPSLERYDVDVVTFAGDEYRGTMGIEFRSPVEVAPSGWSVILVLQPLIG